MTQQSQNAAQWNTYLNSVSLAGNMTAGYGTVDSKGVTSNPPFDNPSAVANGSIYGGNPAWAPNRVGMMRNVPGTVPGLGPGGYGTMYFQYNPNQIGVSFNLNQTSLPPAFLYGTGSATGDTYNNLDPSKQNLDNTATDAKPIPNLTQGQSVSWSLLFDRTYDMLYSPDPGANRGALKDIAALYSLMGTFETAGAVPVSTPIQVIFGVTDRGNIWGFTGFITGVNISYGLFRYDMIPSKAEVDITMMTSYVGPVTPPGGGRSNDRPSGSNQVTDTTIPTAAAQAYANADRLRAARGRGIPTG
jgi:hypothetical protein